MTCRGGLGSVVWSMCNRRLARPRVRNLWCKVACQSRGFLHIIKEAILH